ncbi:bifunctional demethylmenaquinone methyltransferase/2-methoxy-6-polyprenyl-1,4-benzoquinol methylase UbiE [Nitrosophilus kaiyonis]|uniref:bifunctional demethylmenaquinone methyltransferase/2-methoxy-6-polyprenyl-1,4-benzoquinol methylase UbiE n=1 Tax=Nitrosophilus kaiyonis TaxID=2930200 RepID=UPI002492C2F4|nr:bifunctional demethylmenaquinone methyltransferase/2-methoxy-6-polyprenyl-1,4-benzoquinol methylase UbiE [Nitrosophilus kaiyonis]
MDKQKKIVNMFNDIAKTYDLANRVLSFGSDISWRKKACKKAYKYYNKKEIDRITDVACGTGDMLGFWEKIAKNEKIDVKEFLGVDPSSKMLEVAKEKFPHFNYIEAFAQKLPIESESSDFISITYGIRNVVDRIDAIKEFQRVLKKGGVLVILEFTRREKMSLFDNLVEFYMKKVLPVVGGLVSGNKEAYEYLPNSIDNFLTTEQLISELIENGFKIMEVKSFSFGISTMFIAKKI